MEEEEEIYTRVHYIDWQCSRYDIYTYVGRCMEELGADDLSSISLAFLYLCTMIVSPSHTAGVHGHSGAVEWSKQLNTLNRQAPHAREEYKICVHADFICITPCTFMYTVSCCECQYYFIYNKQHLLYRPL